MKAELKIECKNPEIILKSIKPDMDEKEKFKVNLKVANNKVILNVQSEDLSGLLAGINSYGRLIKTAINVMGI